MGRRWTAPFGSVLAALLLLSACAPAEEKIDVDESISAEIEEIEVAPTFPDCPNTYDLVALRTRDAGRVATLVKRYFDERRTPDPDARKLWKMTDEWWRHDAGWVTFREFKHSHEAKPEPSSEDFFSFQPGDPQPLMSSNGTMTPRRHATFQLARVGILREACLKGAWRRLPRRIWWVLVFHPDCACASGGAVDVHVVHRRGFGYRILGIG